MHDNRTKSILESLQQGQISVDDALLQLKLEPFQDLGYAKVDHHRRLRQGVPEVIYGAGKTPEQMVGIVSAMEEAGQETVLITRLSPEAAEIVGKTHPLTYHEMGRILYRNNELLNRFARIIFSRKGKCFPKKVRQHIQRF